jgi:hypothetical protein
MFIYVCIFCIKYVFLKLNTSYLKLIFILNFVSSMKVMRNSYGAPFYIMRNYIVLHSVVIFNKRFSVSLQISFFEVCHIENLYS